MITLKELAEVLSGLGIFLTGLASIIKVSKKEKPSTKKQKAKKR